MCLGIPGNVTGYLSHRIQKTYRGLHLRLFCHLNYVEYIKIMDSKDKDLE
ncbi:hypothetical protein NHP214376_02720 [Helicobacter ailurogastricus]|nr:hypothetical protein NHP214376_02720 [Helicobacter ailurogastricus]GLH59417.1 hypothetical protein NHP214377_06840 [Helicobacter ailurogastricus]